MCEICSHFLRFQCVKMLHPKVAHYLLFANYPQTQGTNTKWSDTVYGYKKGSNFQVDMSFKASTYDWYMIMYVIPLEKSVAHLTQRFEFWRHFESVFRGPGVVYILKFYSMSIKLQMLDLKDFSYHQQTHRKGVIEHHVICFLYHITCYT